MRTASRSLRLGALMLAAAAASANAQATDPRAAQPERPTVATHAHTVAPGYFEIETGVQRDAFGSVSSWSAPVVLKTGLTSRLQLNVSIPVLLSESRKVGYVAVGIKSRLTDGDGLLGDFALLPSVGVPTSTVGNASRDYDLGLVLISSRQVSGVAIDLNASFLRTSFGTSRATTSQLYTASFGIPVTQRLGWVAELYGSPATDGFSTNVSFLTGPTYTVAPPLVLDFGLITPLRAHYAHSVYAGLTWNVGKLFGSAGSASLGRIAARDGRR